MFRRDKQSTDGSGPVASPKGNIQLVLPTAELLKQIFEEFKLTHSTSPDGDLFLPFESFNIVWFFAGPRKEVLQARGILDHAPRVELLPDLLSTLNDWNRTQWLPNAYIEIYETSRIIVGAAVTFDFEVGATYEQIRYSVGTWIQRIEAFHQWFGQNIEIEKATQ
jgi:Putative bacterial sensory transduction regulator